VITRRATGSARHSRLRRLGRVGIVVAALIVGALAVRLLVAPFPSDRLVGWSLTGYGRPDFDSTTAQTTTVIPVFVGQWPTAPEDATWLGRPAITYTPWAVFITMRTSDRFNSTRGTTRGWYDTGGWVDVRLSEPLGGRALFDGSGLILVPRLYP
jgi:hypothetical protein